MNALITWVSGLDLGTLYALLALISFIEAVFPPAPAEMVVAFGAFLAARRGADYTIVVVTIVGGAVGGAMVIYTIARRFGADWMHAKLKRLNLLGAEERLEAMYAHYGMVALFTSRFVPGLRAVVPPMAGALRVPVVRTVLVLTLASTIWYSVIIGVAFRVGQDWEQLRTTVHELGLRVGIAAVVVAALLALVGWRLWKRHRARHPRHAPAE